VAPGGDNPGRNYPSPVFHNRFSTVRIADLIVVLDGARLVEVGSHEELIC
jgi:ATP-binding cassette subfamily B protein